MLVVTYQSAHDIGTLIASLRVEAASQRLRVVVADNASTDGTLAAVRAHSDVIICPTGGNLGYAAGINAGIRAAGQADALLILNPDLRVEPGCIELLRRRQRLVGAGVVVPRIVDSNGATYPSLRREPTLLRALGDAVFGSRLASRPGFLSEIVGRKSEYDQPHQVDWATGAALLIAGEVASKVGEWDERFFLYAEETDFMRRVREAGETIWYEPGSVVQHAQGGSGSSVDLDRLLTVNRIRYVSKHRGAVYVELFRAVVVLHELARAASPAHRAALRTVLSRASWESLPRAQRILSPKDIEAASGAVIIPAHNEAAVIWRTLNRLVPLLDGGNLDVVVATNGCTDNTAGIARSVPGITVLDLAEASKTKALNAADGATDRWPRIYLDADIDISAATVSDTLDALRRDGVLAGRPPYEWDLTGAGWLVRAYYRARAHVPSAHSALWGAGVYAMSKQGRARFAEFPPVVAEDLFVDLQYAPHEKLIVTTDPVRVRVPRSARDLLKVLRRQSRGARELHSTTTTTTLRELAGSIRGPRSLIDVGVYAGFALLSRRLRSDAPRWERDESSRSAEEEVAR
ncbi:MAG: glycosyltransferase [Propionibacteriaceae bacterium]